MSTYFPEIDADSEQPDNLLRKGRRLKRGEINTKSRDFLQEQGLFTLEQTHIVRCANPDDPDYERLSDRQRDCGGVIEVNPEEPFGGYECDKCGRALDDIRKKEIAQRLKVSELNGDKIQEYISSAIEDLSIVESLDKVESSEKDEELSGVFEVELTDGRDLHVVLPRYAPPKYQHRGLFFNPPTLFIHVSPLEVDEWTVLERRQHILLSDFLTSLRSRVSEHVSNAATPIENSPDLQDLLGDLEDAINRHSGDFTEKGTYFELVGNELLRRIEQSPETAQEYLRCVKRLRGTIFGEIRVQLGGSGGTDIISIDKYELLQQLFEGGFIGDAKCYGNSTFGQNERREVLDHLESAEHDWDLAIVIMYGDDIAASTWRRIYGYRRKNNGRWKIMIIPQYLFLELVHVFEARDIFAMNMNEDGELVTSNN